MTLEKANDARAMVANGQTHARVANHFCVNQSTITRIVNNKIWI